MYLIIINGNKIETAHTTVKPILDELGLTEGRYAVEIDGELVPKSELAETPLMQNMVIEVVQAVGGG